MLRCIAEGVVVAAVNGEVEYLNPTALALLLPGGNPGSEVFIGQILKVFDAETLQPVTLPMSRVIMNGESVQMSDMVLQASDQRRIPVDFSLAPLKDENNSTRGMVHRVPRRDGAAQDAGDRQPRAPVRPLPPEEPSPGGGHPSPRACTGAGFSTPPA